MDFTSRALRYCELVRGTGFAQPVNSWSSLVFIFLSIWIVFLIRGNQSKNSFIAIWGYLFAFMTALIGIGSFWNHATLSRIGGTIDVASMFLLVSFLIIYSISRITKIKPITCLFILVITNIFLGFIAWQTGPVTDYVFASLIVGLILTEVVTQLFSPNQNRPYFFWLAVIITLISYIIWQLDTRHVWCNPVSLWQGHSLWHILNALGVGLLFVYYSGNSVKIGVADDGP